MKRVVVFTLRRVVTGLTLSLVIGVAIGVAIGVTIGGSMPAEPVPAIAGSSQAGQNPLTHAQAATAGSPGSGNRLSQVDASPAASARGFLEAGDWIQFERWLSTAAAADVQWVAFGLNEQLRRAIRRTMSKHNAVILRRVLRQYLTAMPEDVEAWFLLADLQLVNGLRENSIETYFQILDMQPSAEVAARARRDVDLLINVMDLEFKTRGSHAEREAFWRHLTARYPPSDFYRYRLAQVLAAGQAWSSAARVLAETGNVDVEQANLDGLLAEIHAAQSGEDEINFTRAGDRLIASVRSLHGLNLALLVDTGATITSLSKMTLRRLGARREAVNVRLQTASGIVDADLYRVAALEIEGRMFENLRVVELPIDISGVDGLLGVDILDQLPWSVENTP